MGPLIEWLLHEPVHFTLVFVLAALTLVLQGYMLISHWRLRRRMMLLEFKQSGLADRQMGVDATLREIRRRSTDPAALQRVQKAMDEAAQELLEEEPVDDTLIKKR